jgi:DNA-binding protein H-NS
MARTNLATMSVTALLKLRDEVSSLLQDKAAGLKKELSLLGDDFVHVARVARYGRKKASLLGRKVPPKYRDKHGNQWAGRGAQPVWLRDALKGGAKIEDFLIAKGAAKKTAAKKKRGRKKKAA